MDSFESIHIDLLSTSVLPRTFDVPHKAEKWEESRYAKALELSSPGPESHLT